MPLERLLTADRALTRRCHAKAKTYVGASQKSLALAQIRTRKALEEVLDRRLGVAEQLRGVVRGIDQASSDAEVSWLSTM